MLTETAHGNVDQAALLLLLSVEELHQERSAEGTRADGIDADILAGMDDSELTAKEQK